ncbi:type II toxin-antitoxin system PemK/MazF family toxin [Stenotrophomonas sp. PD6]|uniref:type II toxin-antitoxin system PemK/MazF family toxin n=1 Tax=Stenotrophomonas sp. PD6 TaxID=3368612 RepID=UPI003BA31846
MNSRIKRGEIYECVFGTYRPLLGQDGRPVASGENGRAEYVRDEFQGPIPFEIQKPRPVVILGDHKGQYVVVPISTTQDGHNNPRKTGEARGLHIRLGHEALPNLIRYSRAQICWAKSNMVQTVDRNRLRPLNRRGEPPPRISEECLRSIQHALIKAIGCQALLEHSIDVSQIDSKDDCMASRLERPEIDSSS